MKMHFLNGYLKAALCKQLYKILKQSKETSESKKTSEKEKNNLNANRSQGREEGQVHIESLNEFNQTLKIINFPGAA